MTANALIGVSVFAAGSYYAQADWPRTLALLVCAVLIWALRDELRSRA